MDKRRKSKRVITSRQGRVGLGPITGIVFCLFLDWDISRKASNI